MNSNPKPETLDNNPKTVNRRRETLNPPPDPKWHPEVKSLAVLGSRFDQRYPDQSVAVAMDMIEDLVPKP